jgi:hypothetical protein
VSHRKQKSRELRIKSGDGCWTFIAQQKRKKIAAEIVVQKA